MSQIVIDIPVAFLSKSGVATALGDLMLALGGHPAETPFHVAAPVVFTDAHVEKPFAVSRCEEKFNLWVNSLETHAMVKAVCAGLQDAGPQGRTIEQIREVFPAGTTNRRVAGVLTALIYRCPQKCGFAPVVKDGDSYRWVGFPQA